ncbi:MAG: magnesium-translocating P-type ATPase [Actinobacteria bacterium]|nr:magnesium-translocating P-type ATPase [Actinomycetota bacterium]
MDYLIFNKMQSPVFWSYSSEKLLDELNSSIRGLTGKEALERLYRYGSNLLKPKRKSHWLILLVSQFRSPVILILIFAAGLSVFLRDVTDALIIWGIVLVSGLLGFWQEKGAANAVEKLLAIVQIRSTILRDGKQAEVPIESIVPGDIVVLNAGDNIPGDCLILESKDLFVNEAALTGETYPEEKSAGILPPETPLNKRTNALFMGTHVVSGTAKAAVVLTGTDTEFGKVSERLRLKPPETEFEHGVRRFGYLLMEITLTLVIAIFAINVFLARPVLDSFLFSLALAVGLTPQLLPVIISINLSHGAKHMAKEKVIVKRLSSIENFGSMNILCSDKTGTLTKGVVQLHSAVDVNGIESEKVVFYSYINAFYETSFTNPIDEAIRSYRKFDISGYQKLDEIPYDFVRKRLSILVSKDDARLMLTKGALRNVLDICNFAETTGGEIVDLGTVKEKINRNFEALSSNGFRVLGIAYRDMDSISRISKEHELGMTFLGLLVLFDPLKPMIIETIKKLSDLGVSLKIVTGDNRLVTRFVTEQIGISDPKILSGSQLREMNNEALLKQVSGIDAFAEIEPNQKERIILMLRKAGNVVGYMGDGINDASALHTADVSISVDSAVDVAKEAAEIVLLEKDLSVLVQGVKEGRTTFSNTLKYVFMATSANFGNMFSMAGASLFLSFLPLLPKQVLLTNLFTDFPEMTIATDSVDSEAVEKPRRWNIRFIRNFMITFGILSSVFDYLTFGALIFILHASREIFRTGWFLESVISASLIVLVIRSRRPFFKSRPGKYLLFSTLLIVGVTLALPYTPIAEILGFKPLPFSLIAVIIAIVVLYIAAAEIVKRIFYKKVRF